MSNIRTTKIDGVEFVTYKDYLRLKEEKQELEYLGDINEELKEENRKLKERIAELEKCNLNLQEQIDKQNRGYEPQFENGFPKYKFKS